MPPRIATAARLAAANGVVHSLLGERVLFRHLRQSALVPARPARQPPT